MSLFPGARTLSRIPMHRQLRRLAMHGVVCRSLPSSEQTPVQWRRHTGHLLLSTYGCHTLKRRVYPWPIAGPPSIPVDLEPPTMQLPFLSEWRATDSDSPPVLI